MKTSLSVRLRLLAAIALIAALPALSGCWSSIELNNRAFVSIMMVDQVDDGIELSLSFPLPNRLIPGQVGGSGSGDGSKEPVAFISRTGKSLEETIQKIQGDLSRKLSFGQTHSVIVGSRFAEEGIEPMLEFVSRNPFLRLNSSLFLVESPIKKKVSQAPVYFERFFASVLNGYLRNRQVLNTTIKDLMILDEAGGDGLIPILTFTRDNVAQSNAPPAVGTGGSVVFRAGKATKVFLSAEETSAARSLLSQLPQYVYSLPSPTDGKKIGFYSTAVRTRIHPVLKNERLMLHVQSLSKANVIGSDSLIDMQNVKHLQQMQDAIAKASDDSLRDVIVKSQQAKADIFHFGQIVEARYPKYWNSIRSDWRTYYAEQLEVDVSSNVSLKRVGSTTRSFRDKYLEQIPSPDS